MNEQNEFTPFEAELFSMMSDAWQGYLLGEEVNIAKIVKEHSLELLERANGQKPAWSEDEELHIRELESLVKQVWAKAEHKNDKDTIHKMSDLSFFLNTLKPQLKQEWSKGDEKMLSDIIKDLVHPWNEYIPDRIEDEIKWLKNRLKPSYSQW